MNRVICSPYTSEASDCFDRIKVKVYGKVTKATHSKNTNLLTLEYEICDVSDPRCDPMIMGALWVESIKDHIPIVIWDNKLWRVSNKIVGELAGILNKRK